MPTNKTRPTTAGVRPLTGPSTLRGKARVARNATKHGIFAAVPTAPGESAKEWEAHRTGVVDALAPVGALEVNLAERVALVLWRLQRLARYEVETIAYEMVGSDHAPVGPSPTVLGLPPLPPVAAPVQFPTALGDDPFDRVSNARRLAKLLNNLGPARDYFRKGPEPGTDGTLPEELALIIRVVATSHVMRVTNGKVNEWDIDELRLRKALGLEGPDPIVWTAEVMRGALAFYAAHAGQNPDSFREGVARELDQALDEAAGVYPRTAGGQLGPGGPPGSRLLPTGGVDERIAKYERHLQGQLTTTLHELERLQARRQGTAVAPPAAADLNVTVDTTAS
jgi:hypothetical protein